jgi:hypothetical protein
MIDWVSYTHGFTVGWYQSSRWDGSQKNPAVDRILKDIGLKSALHLLNGFSYSSLTTSCMSAAMRCMNS